MDAYIGIDFGSGGYKLALDYHKGAYEETACVNFPYSKNLLVFKTGLQNSGP